MNHVALLGNLASDVELTELENGKRVASFMLAVDRSRDAADFFRVTVWDGLAEACDRHLAKGSRVALDGRLRSHAWSEHGRRRTAVDVVAHRVEFLSRTPLADGRAR